MQTNQRELAAQLYFHAVMPLCPPLLRLWLTQDFPDPRRWLAARTTYTETTALWSIAGYVIGLGDRHNDNILIQRRRLPHRLRLHLREGNHSPHAGGESDGKE